MVAMKCDRCGRYREINSENAEMQNCIFLYLMDNYGIVRKKEYYDLCPECAAKLKEFLEGEKNGK